jgi:hypothetical protein
VRETIDALCSDRGYAVAGDLDSKPFMLLSVQNIYKESRRYVHQVRIDAFATPLSRPRHEEIGRRRSSPQFSLNASAS